MIRCSNFPSWNTFVLGSFVIVLVILFLPLGSVRAQLDSSRWGLTIETAIEAHDKRLYGSSSRELLRSQPEYFGTYGIGISGQKKVLNFRRLSLWVGAGAHFQLATFTRPYRPGYKPGDIISFDLRTADRFYDFMIAPELSLVYQLSPRFGLFGRFRPRYRFYTTGYHSSIENSHIWRIPGIWGFEPKSIEYLGGVRYMCRNKLAFELGVRLYNNHFVDSHTVNQATVIRGRSTTVPTGFEKFNPLKLTFSVSRFF
ncbi:hypothetical protein QWY85_10045 [Neolewinella lacunae]|uniref:Outer membrane protein beta-barrel domain-containing protein n=1 Tax=Neolewinella lacunae TaxID=1517758 RepID=A0A923PH16_9BACT|nr:hypothetical protein [Neolewinella lacunae]MBC6993917.1 hypothetical protein [Neolewinella lacunae]MDN3635001.1 hypothetical protein [Neolewinella lacunae]